MPAVDNVLQSLRDDVNAADRNLPSFLSLFQQLVGMDPESVEVSWVTYGNLQNRVSDKTRGGKVACVAAVCDPDVTGDRVDMARRVVSSGSCDTVVIFELDSSLTPPEHVPLHLVSLEHSPLRQKLLAHWPSLNDVAIADPSSIRRLLLGIAEQQVKYSPKLDDPAMRSRTDFLQQLSNSLVARLNTNPNNQSLSTLPHPGHGISARVPYVRVFDAKYSPDPQNGFYCCVFTSSDGSSVEISLQHAAMRSDPERGKLKKLPKAALIAASDEYFQALSAHATFGPVLAKLGATRQLSLHGAAGIIGSYSEAFVHSNIAGVSIPSASLPTDHELMNQIGEFVTMAAHLNSQSSPPPPGPVAPGEQNFFMPESKVEALLDSLSDKSPQIVLAGPPGTGKTLVAQGLASMLLRRHGVSEDEHTKLVLFHPTYGYEDFVEGLRPMANEHGQIEFRSVPGPILRLAKEIENDGAPRVLIIDEINRANIPRVFGELMYLLEYRDEAIDLMLHSNFKLPSQLYIIATMNTADKSTRVMDIALRRRFDFFTLDPDVEALRWFYEHGKGVNAFGDELYEGFTRLNEKLSEELDKHRLIGHSYFMHELLDLGTLRARWDRQIKPLLDEYFFERQAKENQYTLESFFPSAAP